MSNGSEIGHHENIGSEIGSRSVASDTIPVYGRLTVHQPGVTLPYRLRLRTQPVVEMIVLANGIIGRIHAPQTLDEVVVVAAVRSDQGAAHHDITPSQVAMAELRSVAINDRIGYLGFQIRTSRPIVGLTVDVGKLNRRSAESRKQIVVGYRAMVDRVCATLQSDDSRRSVGKLCRRDEQVGVDRRQNITL